MLTLDAQEHPNGPSVTIQFDPSMTPLLSKLSEIFARTMAYDQITKVEALETIAYILPDQSSRIHTQLLGLFLQCNFLDPVPSTAYYRVTGTLRGIFTPLSQCYSTSCSPSSGCYSPTCPHKPVLGPLCLIDDVDKAIKQRRWIDHVPQAIRNSIDHQELMRQAAIADFIVSEQNYCRDLDILHQIYHEPISLQPDCGIEHRRRGQFLEDVFSNYRQLFHLHRFLWQDLVTKRHDGFFIDHVGSIFLRHITHFIEPYICYARHYSKAIYILSMETRSNAAFQRFLHQQDAHDTTRRLGIRHYLSSPTLRIGKHKLLIEAILKRTVDEGDQLALRAYIEILHDLLRQMNAAAELAETETYHYHILKSLSFPGQILRIQHWYQQLLSSNAKLLRQGQLLLCHSPFAPSTTPCHLFLFSNVLLITYTRLDPHRGEEFVIIDRPIPLPMLQLGNPPSFMRRLARIPYSLARRPSKLISSLRQRRRPDMHRLSLASDPLNSSSTYSRLLKLRYSFRKSSPPGSAMPAYKMETEKQRMDLNMSQLPIRSESNGSQLSSVGPSRILKVFHLGYPECSFRFECASIEEQESWCQSIHAAVFLPRPFVMSPICLASFSFSLKPVRLGHELFFPIDCGRVECALSIHRLNGRAMLVLGTQHGVWMGYLDGSGDFQMVIAQNHCQALQIMDDMLLVLVGTKRRALIGYPLETLSCSLQKHESIAKQRGRFLVRRSPIVVFTTGMIHQHPTLAYIIKRAGKLILVISLRCTATNVTNGQGPWFKKYKAIV
ncbi:uncharacterized protein BYT42DRAFT_395942 [Radiomyces spectabilis]|uniref:uncharacterized protein n=1 Tax=Radiomyces spectabilis TaxID=64574 RepID=UPI00221F44B6|nr:uncharacterized protein BYT42DRAFT_395942 [Radiomyces spectabilis]KAI8374232.1 hypothetical protein BYT42DRAFT_395942 [Radiomyces spectabilis]